MYSASQISVTTAATPIVVAGDSNSIVTHRGALVRNAGAASVWLGGATVAAGTGLELPAGASLPLATTSPDTLYAIAASGTVRVDVLLGDQAGGLGLGAAGQQARARALGVALSAEDVALLDGSSITTLAFAIAAGASLSGGIDLAGKALLRLRMPAAWTTANLTVQTSADNATWNDLYDAVGVEYTIVVAASRSVIIPPADFAAMRWVRFRSGTASVAVAQASAVAVDATVRVL